MGCLTNYLVDNFFFIEVVIKKKLRITCFNINKLLNIDLYLIPIYSKMSKKKKKKRLRKAFDFHKMTKEV
jgi:hypothetical protein